MPRGRPKNYMQATAGSGTQGGETCPKGGAEPWRDGNAVIARMDADRSDYIHGSYAPGFRSAMVAANTWDTIKTRLGNRYHASEVTYPDSATAGASVTVSVRVQNDGFGRIPLDRNAYSCCGGP